MSAAKPINPEQVEAIGRALAENGRVLATLDDWRAIVFSVVIISSVVIVALIGVIIALLRSNRQERRDIQALQERAFGVADKFGDASGKLVAELQVQQALNARVEGSLGRVEDLLETLERNRGDRG